MKNRLKISRSTIIRLGFFVALIAGALLFDSYHTGSASAPEKKHNTEKSQSQQISECCFYTSLNSFKLKNTTETTASCKLFFRTQSRFLQQYHNVKANQLSKNEALKNYEPSDLVLCQLSYRRCLHKSPDDTDDLRA